MLMIIFVFVVMCVAAAMTFPKLDRLKRLDRSLFSSVPTEKYDEWYQLEMKSLKLMALVCNVYFWAVVPLLGASFFAILGSGEALPDWLRFTGLQFLQILPSGCFLLIVIVSIMQIKPAKRAKIIKKEYAISY